MADSLIYEVESRVVRITLNRPDKRNALDEGLPQELIAALRRAQADPGVTVILLRAARTGRLIGKTI